MKVAGLFAGIGGIELGLEHAGHETALLSEIDESACAVLESRFPGVPLQRDVTELERLPAGCELVTAGFPCQDLSQAGRTRGIEGQRSGLVAHLFRLLERDDVPWVLIENVPFMLQLEKGAAMDFVVSRFEELGYRWAYRVVDSRAFGLPQRRRRVYLLASKADAPEGLLFNDEAGPPPDQSYEGKACGFYWTEGSRGLGWAVDAVPTLKGGSSLGIPSPPAIWLPNGQVVTPDIRDAERLQGFEADWTQPAAVVGRKSLRWKLVGNAVSVPAAAWVGGILNDSGTGTFLAPTLGRKGSWPSAAFGSQAKRFVVDISEWPERRPAPPLIDFLQYTPKPLSERATAGFLGRLKASSLRYPREFEAALEAHLDTHRVAAS